MSNEPEIRVRDVYRTALAIVDEEDSPALANRAVAITNTLIGRCWLSSESNPGTGRSKWTTVDDMDDALEGLDKTLCLSVMPYGLGAMLVLDYDPVKSRSLWSVFLENLEWFKNASGSFEGVEDIYAGIEKGEFARW